MADPDSKQKLYLSDGIVTENDVLVLSAGFLQAPDAASSRILLMFDDGWASHDVEDDFVISMAYSSELGKLFALGRNGLIKSVGEKNAQFNFENIRGRWESTLLEQSESKGNMSKIKCIGRDLYACGWGSQVYRLENGEWKDIFDSKIESERYGFLDIGGVSGEDIYVIGMDGIVFHYDGVEWSKKDIGTNSNLHCIYADSGESVYIAGAQGTLYAGSKDVWGFIGDDEFKENIWSMDMYESKLYFTHANTGLSMIDDETIVQLDMHLDKSVPCHHLYASKDMLLSIGPYDLVSYNGINWEYVDWPKLG